MAARTLQINLKKKIADAWVNAADTLHSTFLTHSTIQNQSINAQCLPIIFKIDLIYYSQKKSASPVCKLVLDELFGGVVSSFVDGST